MRDTTDIDAITELQLVEMDSAHGAVPILEYDVISSQQVLDDDLAELPPAFAAYRNYQQNQWS